MNQIYLKFAEFHSPERKKQEVRKRSGRASFFLSLFFFEAATRRKKREKHSRENSPRGTVPPPPPPRPLTLAGENVVSLIPTLVVAPLILSFLTLHAFLISGCKSVEIV